MQKKSTLVFFTLLSFLTTQAIFAQSTAPHELIADYLEKADSYGAAHDYDNTLLYYEKALELQKQTFGEKNIETVILYETIGQIYCFFDFKRDYDKSLAYYKKAVAIREELFGENSLETAKGYENLASGYFYFNGDFDTALNYYEKILHIQKKNLGENHLDLAETYNAIGTCYDGKGDVSNGLHYYEAALSIARMNLGDTNAVIAKYYYNIGTCYGKKGDYDKELSYYETALLVSKNADEADNELLVYLYSSLGAAYYDKADYDVALSYYEKALDIQKTFERHYPQLANIYANIGELYATKGDYDKGLEYCNEALSINEKMQGKEHPDTAQNYYELGIIYSMKGNYEAALTYHKTSLAIQEKILGSQHPATGMNYFMVGFDYLNLSDTKSAIEYWEKSHTGFNHSFQYSQIIDCLSAQLFSQFPDPAFTRKTLTLATDTVERARLDLASLKDDILRKSLPIYYYGVQFEAEQKNPKKAFEYSESLRSRGFLDQIGTEAALKLDGVTESEREQIHSLTSEIAYQRKIIEEENARTLSERDEARLSGAGKKLSEAEKSLADLDKKIARRIPAYAQLRNPVPVSAGEAQKWCGKKRAVLEYVLWNPELSDNKDAAIKSYCIVLTKKKVSVVELDGSYDYAAAIDKLRGGIMGMKRESQFEAVRNELYEKLLSPVLPYVAGGTKELVIVPDGNLSFLPFDVLRKDADSKVLGDKYAVAFSPSVSVSVISGGKKTGEKNMLAFGGAWYDTKLSSEQHRANFTSEGISRGAKRGSQGIDFELTAENDAQLSFMKNDIQKNGPKEYFRAKNLVWQDLPGTITELNALKDGVFKSDSFSQIVQEEASERTVKRLSQEGKLARYPILHFACHGYFDNKIADMSSVLFSEVSLALEGSSDDDGYLTIPETAVLKLNADLVCLSACETGLGKIKAGDGMVGLSRAFMVAGAESVGVSLWCVDDEATAKFMAAMYEKVVKKGMDYVSAYQKTKAEFRKDEDFDHPYYWAAFMLYE